MKICTNCSHRFADAGWTCPVCAEAPPTHGGAIPMLAPELAASGDGFDPASFDHLAQLEDANFWFRARNRLVTWAVGRHFPTATSLFELGCGNGYVLAGIHRKFPEIELAAGDLYAEGLDYARERVPVAEMMQVDGRALPFEQHFDVTCAFDVLEHIDDHAAAARSLFEATRSGGGIIVTVPQHRWLWSAADEYARHCRRYRRRELRALLEGAGFRVERLTSFASTVLPLMAFSRLTMKKVDEGYDPVAEYRIGRATNAVLERMMDIDRLAIRAGMRLPAGGSLLAVARRD